MGMMVYSFLWVLQDLYHQPYFVDALRRRTHVDVNPVSLVTLKPDP